jgi:GNAT superfamily N-acetyltransferase
MSLAELLDRVAAGRFPPPDGSVTILPQPSPRYAGVLSFTAHAVIFADTDPGWIRQRLPPGDLAAPMHAGFLHELGQRTGRSVGSVDMVCVAHGLAGPPGGGLRLRPAASTDHPRVRRALRYRDQVRAWETPGGIVLTGRGVAGRREVAIEVDPGCRNEGLGRQLARAGRHLVPAGTPLWAQIAPGNAASVRAFLAAGFVPVGAEALLAAP